MEITHLEIRSALHGAAFPAAGDDLAAVARTNQAPIEVVDLLDRLPADDEFDSVEELLDELNIDHTAIEDTTELRVALGIEDPADLERHGLADAPPEEEPEEDAWDDQSAAEWDDEDDWDDEALDGEWDDDRPSPHEGEPTRV